LINFSDVTGPPVDLLLRDKAPAHMSAVSHSELDPFKRNFAAAGDIGPCHVKDGFRPLKIAQSNAAITARKALALSGLAANRSHEQLGS
jgi:hypothetical protein